jgi:hypothetical protein
MMVALGTAFMIIGAVIEVLDMSVCALSSLLVVFVYLEIGSYYPWLVWICTTLATGLLYPGSILWVEYALMFGIYPLIKSYIERLPRWCWLIVKLVYANFVIVALFFVCEKLLGVPFFTDEAAWMRVLVYVLTNIAFLAFDYFIVVMVRFYLAKLRPRFKRFLK